jgi:hypothetical protein
MGYPAAMPQNSARGFIEVGALVRHRHEPGWGLGQVQSIIGARVTVNFEHRGKVVLHGADLPLDLVASDDY